jgi:hypothetical protein
MAHINEHIAFEYRKQVEMAMGMPLPNEEQNKQVPPELADQIAMMTAKASQQLTQQAQQQAAATTSSAADARPDCSDADARVADQTRRVAVETTEATN